MRQSLAAEIERIEKLSVEERIVLALGMKERFRGLATRRREDDRRDE